MQYKEQVEGQKIEEVKLVKVEEVKEWEVEKILNKRKIKKYKGSSSWVWEKIECRSKTTREVEYNRDFRKGKLLRKYTITR